jgi:SAM-dependent methyltransferase
MHLMNANTLNLISTSTPACDGQSGAPKTASTLEQIIQRQLGVMAKQLEILRGAPAEWDSAAAAAHPSSATIASRPATTFTTLPRVGNNPALFSLLSSVVQAPRTGTGYAVGGGCAPELLAGVRKPLETKPSPVRRSVVELEKIEAVLNTHPALMFSKVINRDNGSGQPRIIAYVVERNEANPAQIEQVRYWRSVWDGLHQTSVEKTGIGGEPTHAFLRSIQIENPEAQERQFIFQTVDRVRALGAESIYEIGCGTGSLVRELQPHCRRYWASDFSESAVSYLRGQFESASRDLPEGVEFLHRGADDFSGIDPKNFDLVLIHSVAQYFPDIAYLLRVLDGAIRTCRSGGCVYLGAIQNSATYEAYHTNLQASRAPLDLPVGELQKRVRKRLGAKEEFTIDPAFFQILARQNPRIAAVDIRLRRGTYHNKSTKFLYDAILHIGQAPARVEVDDWRRIGSAGLSEVRRILETQQPETIGFCGLPNSRLQKEIEKFERVSTANPATLLKAVGTAGEASGRSAVDPEDLWTLGESLSYRVHVNWAADGCASSIDVVFTRLEGIATFPTKRGFSVTRGLAGYVNNWYPQTDPGKEQSTETLRGEKASRLREFLTAQLPESMLPDAFIAVPEIPLLPDGATNIQALPDPDLPTWTGAGNVPPPRPCGVRTHKCHPTRSPAERSARSR